MSELAADGIPVAVTCRVLKLARQPYYRWLAQPVTDAELARGVSGERVVRRPPRRPGVRLPVPGRRGPRTPGSRWPSGPRGGSARDNGWWSAFGKPSAGKGGKAGPPVHDDLVRRDFTADGAEPAVAHRHHRTPHRRRQALPLRDQGRVLQPDRRLLHRLTDEVPPGRRRPATTPSPARGDVAGCVAAHRPRVAISQPEVRPRPRTATTWSDRWAESAPPATTPPWNRSSACCRRTSSTAAPGPPASNSGSRS